MSSIRKLGDKRYRIVYDAPPRNGKRRQMTETLVGVTKAKAEAILADRKRDVTGGQFVADQEMTLNDLFDRFMEVKSRKCAADHAPALRQPSPHVPQTEIRKDRARQTEDG